MKIKIWVSFVLILVFPSIIYSKIKAINLFHIERNKNQNIVQYFIKMNSVCEMDEYSLKGEWRDFNNGNYNSRRDLTTFQRLAAYGVSKIKRNDDAIYFKLNALNKYDLKIISEKKLEGCLTKTFIRFEENWHELNKIYVFAKEGFILPTVKYIDFYLLEKNNKSFVKKIKF